MLRKLDGFELLIVEDIAYVKQSPDEAEVLFTLIAERCESRSLLITSNLVFSEWERIFKEPMATAAAIDRVVHPSVILEFNVPSYRSDEAASQAISLADRRSCAILTRRPRRIGRPRWENSTRPTGSFRFPIARRSGHRATETWHALADGEPDIVVTKLDAGRMG